ncbi:RING [Musa troglodytarum]|uniref:RING n=1 Tax=Musa troglodytarum TaxID=320322 RepID=A0A9E7H9S5_9LILI|nr:RING [Musa troglodytarum]
MEGMQAPPPSHGSSVPVVIKLRYSVLHFFGGGVTVQPPSTCRYFLFELSEFLHQESRRRAVSLLLSHINVHSGDFSVAQFLEDNFNTLSDDLVEIAMGSGRGIETEIDALFITVWGEEEDSFDYDLGTSSDSIAKLQAVRYEHGGGDFRESSCMICFEGFEVGMEVTRMPCMHVFHGDCLTRWLERSRLCPLCRHQLLPASADP